MELISLEFKFKSTTMILTSCDQVPNALSGGYKALNTPKNTTTTTSKGEDFPVQTCEVDITVEFITFRLPSSTEDFEVVYLWFRVYLCPKATDEGFRSNWNQRK